MLKNKYNEKKHKYYTLIYFNILLADPVNVILLIKIQKSRIIRLSDNSDFCHISVRYTYLLLLSPNNNT